MPVRHARWRDLEAVNHVLTKAFWEEDACSRILHPHQKQYPNDVIKYWRGKTRLSYWAWTNVLLVATDEDDNVVAVASWEMKGRVAEKAKPPWWSSKHAMGNIITWYNSAEAWLWPNRAADPIMVGPPDVFERTGPFIKHLWECGHADGYYLDLLGVDPAAQKHGYGKMLVQWGLQKAKEEGVCASVISSYGSDPFYLKAGFEKVVGTALEGEGNPLKEAEAKGGSVLFMEAPAG